MIRYLLPLALLAGCTAQQAQQVQTAVTVACAIEGAAAPVAISVAPKNAEDITKADMAAKAACAALKGVVVTTAPVS